MFMIIVKAWKSAFYIIQFEQSWLWTYPRDHALQTLSKVRSGEKVTQGIENFFWQVSSFAVKIRSAADWATAWRRASEAGQQFRGW
jgi:hypothetical protein